MDKIYLYVKDPYEDKCQYLIKKRESIGLKYFNDPKAFIDIRMICMMFMEILMIIILIKKVKY